MKIKNETISALIKLLEDEDKHVSTLAMEELLKMNSDCDRLVKDLQEASSPMLRNRIHQMGNVLTIRRERERFIENVRQARLGLWEGMLAINYHYHPQMNRRSIDMNIKDLVKRLPKHLNSKRLAKFMTNEEFTPTAEDTLGADLFLVEDVLYQRIGSPTLLAVIAAKIAEEKGFKCQIVLHQGKHCLLDEERMLIEPGKDWVLKKLEESDNVHYCDKRDIWFNVLSQLFLAAMLEGSLQAIHRVGSILAKLCGAEFNQMPYPLGS